MLRLGLATAHLIALGLGLGSVLVRGYTLGRVARERPAGGAIRIAFFADTMWGVAAVLWISTGLGRLIAGTEKPPAFYYHDVFFVAKMILLGIIIALEAWPMATLIRWRVVLAKGRTVEETVPPAKARRIALISAAQSVLVVGMVVCATAMARGYGAR